MIEVKEHKQSDGVDVTNPKMQEYAHNMAKQGHALGKSPDSIRRDIEKHIGLPREVAEKCERQARDKK